MHAIEWGPGAQPHASNTRTAAPAQRADSVSIQADRLMLVLIVLFSLVAVVIGYVLSDVTLPALVGGGLSAAAVALVMTAAGSSLNRFVLPLLLCATVALHIQASLGMEEFHFGVFVTLALVMVYRDWRVVLACALFLAVHHVLFDRLQAWGWGLYCITEPSFGRVLLHAAYVVLQTGVEIFIVHRMAQAFSQERELQHLVQQVDQPHTMALDMGQQEVHTGAAQRLHRMFARVHDTVASVKLAAGTLHQASTHIAAGSEALAARSVQAQQSVEETAAAAHELRQSVASTAQIAQHAHDLIEQAASNAHRGGAMVGELVEHMRTIEKVSAQIADIVAVVDGLAFQTNLLALNAAVEAARAGEQGRGFAVVADEVRRLALRSSDAAKGIRRQIDQSSQAVAQGAALSGDVQTVMLGFATDIADVAQQMETIAQAAVQQHEGIAQISDSIGQLEQVTTHNADLAEQSRSAAQYVQTNAHQMLEHANLFTTSGDQSAAVAPKLRTSSLAIA